MNPLAIYRLALDPSGAALAAVVRALVSALYDQADREASMEVLTPLLTRQVRLERMKAYDVGVDLLRAAARLQGVDDPHVPAPSGYPEAAVQTVLREKMRGTRQQAEKAVADRLVQHVEAAAREVQTRAAEDGRRPAPGADEHAHWSPTTQEPDDTLLYVDELDEDDDQEPTHGRRALSWARVLTGSENCAFCVMLASRGPVYSGPDEAGRMQATDSWPDARGYVNSYHDNCDCIVVPIYDFTSWPGREAYQALDEWYQKVVANPLYRGTRTGTRAGSKDDPTTAKNPALAALDRELREMKKQGQLLPVPDLRS